MTTSFRAGRAMAGPAGSQRRRSLRAVALWPLAALVLASCSGGGSEADKASLDEETGFDLSTAGEREVRAEAVIQTCMEGKGFEYVAVDPAARRAALIGSTGVAEADFEKQYGYGITTLYERRREQAASGPNQRIRASLAESERAAYDRALSGDNLDATFAEAVSTGDFSRLGGCTREAAEAVYGGGEVLRSVQAGLEEVEARVLADPRMVKAVKEWSDCMRDKGFELTTPEDVDLVLQRKLAAIVGNEPLAAVEPGATPSYDSAALQALQKEEVEMVTADIECEEDHIEDVESEVRTRYEDEFREQNVDLLTRVPKP